MRAWLSIALATLLATSLDRVNLKLKSNDGMGALGRGEGMAALAIVLIEAVND